MDTVVAEVVSQHGAKVFGRVLALLKQLFTREFSIRCLESSVKVCTKEHLKH